MPDRPSVLVLFDHGRGPEPGVDFEVDRDAFPYGYGEALDHLRLTASTSAPESRIVWFLRRGTAFVLGFDLVHAYRNRRAIDAAEVVVTHTEHEHLAVAALRLLGLVGDARIVGQSIWLWDHWNRTGPLKRLLYRRLLREIEVHSTHSPVNAAFGTRVLGVPVHLVPYGAHVPRTPVQVDVDAARDARSQVIEVVAPGSDRHRDWRALVEAARRAPELRVTIVSRRLRARWAARRCDRVRVVAARSFPEVQARMRDSTVVAIPLKPNMHVSGLSVLYEGLLAHRPIAMTRTGGADYYGAQHVDWAVPGDPDALVAAIRSAARRVGDVERLAAGWYSVAERGLTLDDYGRRHVLAVWMALGRPVDPALIEAARPIAPLLEEEASRLAEAAARA